MYVIMGDQRIAEVEYNDLAAEILSDLAPLNDDFSRDSDGEITAADAWIAFAMNEGIFNSTSESNTSVETLLASSAR